MKAGVLLIQAFFIATSFGGTNIIVTPGASTAGSTIISYSADSPLLYGGLSYKPRKTYSKTENVTITDWIETDKIIGYIKQANETYQVVGNVNEYGVAIGGSTFEGLPDLQHQDKGIIEYGSLMQIALQRSKSAREAITVMTNLVEEYGYYSRGESFTIADSKEAWVLEMIGKGNYELGAVWVAMRVQDGYVTAHANQARIQQFPRNDPLNCMYSSDVVSFAKKHGFYPSDASEEDFSFSDVYSPMNFTKARHCEARVWSFFRKVLGESAMEQYTDYALGHNLSNRMPWSFKPSSKLSYRDVINCMRDFYEETPLSFTKDVGAGPFNAPYRNSPLDYEVNGNKYVNERPTATQESGWVMVAELRADYPDPMKGINWFAVDDSKTTVFVPFHSSITKIPSGYAVGDDADIMHANLKSAFWLFNIVAQMTYSNWMRVYPEVIAKINTIEDNYESQIGDYDKKAAALYNTGYSDEATYLLTEYSEKTAEALISTWYDFWMSLLPKYIDGYIKELPADRSFPNVKTPGYSDEWYEKIVKDTDDKYLVY